jgi:hypothetical protein
VFSRLTLFIIYRFILAINSEVAEVADLPLLKQLRPPVEERLQM